MIQRGFGEDSEASQDDYQSPVIPHRPVKDTAELDITPMIDITFLLLIFFLVASTADVPSQVDLPPARYGEGVSERNSAIITIAEGAKPDAALVYLADGTLGTPLPGDETLQQRQIAAYVQEQGKPNVLLKGAKGVPHREVSRVAAAAAQVEGIQLHWGVLEVE